MDDLSLEMKNSGAISRAHEDYLTPPSDDPCGECGGTGYAKGTETEHTWGDRCPNKCPHNPKIEPTMDAETIRMLRAS